MFAIKTRIAVNRFIRSRQPLFQIMYGIQYSYVLLLYFNINHLLYFNAYTFTNIWAKMFNESNRFVSLMWEQGLFLCYFNGQLLRIIIVLNFQWDAYPNLLIRYLKTNFLFVLTLPNLKGFELLDCFYFWLIGTDKPNSKLMRKRSNSSESTSSLGTINQYLKSLILIDCAKITLIP